MENRDPQSEKFDVGWNGPDDKGNPLNIGSVRKWIITVGISICTLNVAWSSSIFTATYTGVEEEFHVSQEVAIITLTLFIFGMGAGSMVYSPLSEFYGRRIIYILSFTFFVAMDFLVAFAPNIGAVLIGRLLSGTAGSAFLATAGGTIADMYTKDQLGLPMAIYTSAPLLGPSLGPITGNFITANCYWRWVPRVMLCFTGSCLIFIITCVPETYAPVLLRWRAQRIRKKTGDDRFKAPIEHLKRSVLRTVLVSCKRPFQIMVLDPMVFLLCLHTSLGVGINYLFFDAFPLVFETNKGFKQEFVGLCFLGISVGVSVGVCTTPIWNGIYERLKAKNGGVPEPEFRLPMLMAGAICMPIGVFLFGFTSYKSIHYMVPICMSSFFGIGLMFLLTSIFTYLVESYKLYAASVLAANNFMRSSFAAAFPLFGIQMYNKLTYPWASALLGFILVGMIPAPFLFFKYGKVLRGRSRFGYVG
ncbi:major facilitator superfamily domain-containing protein [Lipomyces oligophaga]|uniref:major facilitator superfamily domain-containing protein n=1 Tax=Lipomyces oligophaga TaxID=45792 RepID=UPI0034D01F09